MQEARHIALKGLLALALLVPMHFVYVAFFLEDDLMDHSRIIDQVRAVQDSSAIIYFGESSNFTVRDEDSDKRPISQFLGLHFPGKHLGTVNKGALHAGNFLTLLQNVPEGTPLETVVITMNLRSFNAQWLHSKLETALQKSMVLLKPGPAFWRRFLLSFRAYDIKTVAERKEQYRAKWARDVLEFPYDFPYKNVVEWDAAIAKAGVKDAEGNFSKGLTGLAAQYVKTYAFQIDTLDNPRIAQFDAIVDLCAERGWKLVFHLLAENVERAGQLVGKDLVYLMQENRKLLRERYRKRAIFVDNFDLLPNPYFIDQDWTTEHYGEAGRKAVAGKIAEAMQPLYPDVFTKPEYKDFGKYKAFFNDCEGTTIWGQMASLSDDRAYSGRRSARVGKKGAFSVTFTRAVPEMDTSALDSVVVRFMYLQEEKENLASVALEAGGAKTGYLWDTTAVRRYTDVVGEWVPVEMRLPLYPNIREAEVMKVYVYNPSPYFVWVDDIGIEFY